MGKYCSDCKHFNTKKPKKEGATGCCKCMKEKDKKKEFKLSCMEACDKFEEDYGRNWYEKEKLYDDGKKINDSGKTGEIPWFMPIILAIIAIIAKTFGLI